MLRLTDQYFWNFTFTAFFAVCIVMAMIILHTEAARTPESLTLFDMALMILASWRLTRLFVYDAIMKWFREQFWDASREKGGATLRKPKGGPRRTVADLLSCPWCFGIWAAATVTFFYLLTPLAFYPVLLLAVSAVATYLQLLANLTGYAAENQKEKSERGF